MSATLGTGLGSDLESRSDPFCSFASSALISGRGGAGSTDSAAANPSAMRSASCAEARAGSAATAAFSSASAFERTPGSSCQPGKTLSCCHPLNV